MIGQTEPTTEQQNAYARGVKAGQVDYTLADLGGRIDKMDGSLSRFADEQGKLALSVQRLGDEARSAAATLIATAQALKDEREATAAALKATTERSVRRFSPASQLATIFGTFVMGMAVVVTIYLHYH